MDVRTGMATGGIGLAAVSLVDPSFIVPWWVYLLVAGLALLATYKSTSVAGSRVRILSIIVVLLVIFWVAAVALMVTPAGEEIRVPTFDVEAAEAAACYNFPDFTTDADCATGTTEITVDKIANRVAVFITVDDSADTVTPDSFAVALTVRRTDGGWREQGVTVSVPVLASLTPAPGQLLLQRVNDSQEQSIVAKSATSNLYQIALQDFADNAIVGKADGGSMGTLAPGASDIITLTVYFDETFLTGGASGANTLKKSYTATVSLTSQDSAGNPISIVDVVISIELTLQP